MDCLPPLPLVHKDRGSGRCREKLQAANRLRPGDSLRLPTKALLRCSNRCHACHNDSSRACPVEADKEGLALGEAQSEVAGEAESEVPRGV